MSATEAIRSLEYWRTLQPGTYVQLTDTQTMMQSLGTDQAPTRTYEITSINVHEELSDHVTFYVCRMANIDGEILYLIAKAVDDDAIDVGIYFDMDEFEPRSREDLFDDGDTWIFLEPEDTEDFHLLDLEFAETISLSMTDNLGTEFQVQYDQTDVGALQTRTTYNPTIRGVEDHLSTIVEFAADDDRTENLRIMIIETGEEDNEEGGVISVLIGDHLDSEFEINILHHL